MSLPEFAIDPAADEPVAFCADIGGSYIKFGRAFGAGRIRVEAQVQTPVLSWPDFRASLTDLVERHGETPARVPLAISTAGLFDPSSGQVHAANIPCLKGHDLVSELSDALQRPVLIANDADSFALAEASVGVGERHDIVFGIILGTGVGGGLAIGGRMVKGRGGVAGEWGHGAILRTELDIEGVGPIQVPRFSCGCGRSGCVDTVGGARGLERLHRHLSGQTLDSHAILDGWEAGALDTSRTARVYVELLAEPLAFAVNILGPSIVPVGGGLAARSRLVAALDEAVRQRTLHRYGGALVVPGRFQTDGGLVGVSVLAVQR